MLVVDDDLGTCEVLTKMIRVSDEYRVVCAHNGKEALKMIARQKPDAVILDIRMPGINGVEVLKKLKKHPDTLHIPIIMLTGYADKENRETSIYCYADTFLSKPCTRAKLLQSLNTALSWCSKECSPSNACRNAEVAVA